MALFPSLSTGCRFFRPLVCLRGPAEAGLTPGVHVDHENQSKVLWDVSARHPASYVSHEPPWWADEEGSCGASKSRLPACLGASDSLFTFYSLVSERIT